jgi:hypothetical protein
MAKKPIKNKNKKSEKNGNKKDNLEQKDNKIKTKKFSIKVTSKMKKKLKYTQNKLKIDKIKIKKIISHIIKSEPPIIKEIKNNEEIEENDNSQSQSENDIEQEGGVPIYLYITLKKDLKEEEKRILKNKLLKIKYSMINNIIYICLIEDKLTNEEKDELKKITNSRIDIITKEELKDSKKNLKDINLDNQYQLFVSNLNNNIYLNKKWDIVYYQNSKFDIIKNIIEKISKGATILKFVNKKNNILKIKFGYTIMDKEELTDNAYRLVYKTIPFVLSNAEKYNGIENIIIKTNNSIPFSAFGEINAENINFYK